MPNHCQFVDMYGVCFSCDDGYHLKANICVPDSQGLKGSQAGQNAKLKDNLRGAGL